MRRTSLATALLIAVSATPAIACIPPPPIAPLPGESDQAYQARREASFQALQFEERRAYQQGLLEHSADAFIGVVIATRDITLDGSTKGHEVTIRPASAIKGDLPAKPVVLADSVLTSCGIAGAGTATRAAPNDYVIVFLGVPQAGETKLINVGILANEAQWPDLLYALARYGRDSSH